MLRRKPIAAAKPVKVVAALHLHYYLEAGKHETEVRR